MADVTVTIKLTAPKFRLLEEVFTEASASLQKTRLTEETGAADKRRALDQQQKVEALKKELFS